MFLMPATRSLIARNGSDVWATDVFRALDRIFDDGALPARAEATRAPALDVRETDTAYVVTVDLPGVSKEQVKVSIEGKRVRIEAEVKTEEEKKDGDRVIYSERRLSSFARSFALPLPVKEEGAEAKLEKGVLMLTLPKQISAAKQLTVN